MQHDQVDMPEVMRAQRQKLGLSQQELAKRVDLGLRQIARYESGEQQPTFAVVCRIADALDLTLDQLRGSYNMGLDLAGEWYMAWQTWKDGKEYYTVQRVRAAQQGERLILMADRGDGTVEEGYYAWRGELAIWDNRVLLGWYVATDGASSSKGTITLVLNAQGQEALGMWTGVSHDGVLAGRGAMARTAELSTTRVRKGPPSWTAML